MDSKQRIIFTDGTAIEKDYLKELGHTSEISTM